MKIARSFRNFVLTIGTLTVLTMPGWAQGVPQGVPQGTTQNPTCLRLEAQLAAFDRGGQDAGRSEQARRYEDALRRQQAQLERIEAQSQRLGCQGRGFFSLFQNQPPQCTSITTQIQQLRASIGQLLSQIQQLQGNSSDRSGQRQAIIGALARNDCGPQYRAAAQPGNFFEALFGPGTIVNPGSNVGQSSTYRTLCVRTCDGYYFPISYATVPARFADDAQACRRMCPGAEVLLFSHRNPGEDVAQAVSAGGGLYSDLPNAFKYRKEYNAACGCKRSDQSWADALKDVDDPSVERGDIVVTEERAKAMSQPRGVNGQIRTSSKTSGASATPTNNPSGKTDAATGSTDEPAADTPKRKIRSVGPTFLPTR
jgi:hypothetical protein